MPFKTFALAYFFVAALVGNSSAAVLDASPIVADHSPFQIAFDDLNGDRVFSGLSEMTSFSGVTIWTNYRSSIYQPANIGGITSNCPGGCSGTWIFGTEGEGIIVTYASNWTYTLSGLPPILAGDYNGDHVVDAADYVLWRNGGPLLNDPTPGVQPADYGVWRSNFGQVGGSGSSLGSKAAVPEPVSLVVLPLAILGIHLSRRSLGSASSISVMAGTVTIGPDRGNTDLRRAK